MGVCAFGVHVIPAVTQPFLNILTVEMMVLKFVIKFYNLGFDSLSFTLILLFHAFCFLFYTLILSTVKVTSSWYLLNEPLMGSQHGKT